MSLNLTCLLVVGWYKKKQFHWYRMKCSCMSLCKSFLKCLCQLFHIPTPILMSFENEKKNTTDSPIFLTYFSPHGWHFYSEVERKTCKYIQTQNILSSIFGMFFFFFYFEQDRHCSIRGNKCSIEKCLSYVYGIFEIAIGYDSE